MNQRRVLKLQKRIAQLREARCEIQRWGNLFRRFPKMRELRPSAPAAFDRKCRQVNDSLKRLVKKLALLGSKPVERASAIKLARHADDAFDRQVKYGSNREISAQK